MSRTPVKAHGFAPRQSSPLARRAAWGGDGASEDEPVSPWRQVFKERCMDRIRQSRADVVRSRRFGLAAQSPAQGATALVAAGAVAGGSPEGAAVPQHQQPFRFRPMLGEEIMASRRRSAVRQVMEAEWRRLQQESSQHGIDPERGLEIEAEIISELMDEQASGPDVLDTYEGDAGTQSSTALADAEMDMDESQTLRSEICPVCQLPTLSEAPGRIECANCGLFVAVESPCPAASQRTSGSQSRSACTKQRQSPNLAEFQVGLHQIAEQHSTQCHFGTLQAGFDASIGLFFICSHCDELAIA